MSSASRKRTHLIEVLRCWEITVTVGAVCMECLQCQTGSQAHYVYPIHLTLTAVQWGELSSPPWSWVLEKRSMLAQVSVFISGGARVWTKTWESWASALNHKALLQSPLLHSPCVLGSKLRPLCPFNCLNARSDAHLCYSEDKDSGEGPEDLWLVVRLILVRRVMVFRCER